MTRTTDSNRDPMTRLALVGVTLAALAFFVGTLAAPLLSSRGMIGGALLRAAYAPVCHQLADRSMAIADGTQAVCARCSGLYLGGVIGLAAGTLWLAAGGRRPRPLWLALAVAPTAVDWLLPWVGWPGKCA